MVTTKKTSTKTTQSAETTTPKVETKTPAKKAAAKKVTKKSAAKAVAAEQMTLVDALPVAVEPPTPAPRATRVTAPPVEDKPRRAEDMGPQKVRAVLHPEHNSRGRGRSEAEKRESYARYRANKKKAKELEERNTRHLILFPASDADTNAEKFYNMGGNSAIIYCHELGPRLKRNPVLRRDMDLGPDRFHSGVCSISNLESLTQRLAEIGVKRRPDYGELVIFKLAREYPKDEIREMLKQEQARLDNLNKLLYAEVLFPDIHRQMIELKRMVPAKVKNMDKTYRDVIGMRMVDSLMELVRNYTEMAHGDVDAKTAGGKMMLELDMILAEISILNELKLWEISTCTRIASAVVTMRQLIRGKILNK